MNKTTSLIIASSIAMVGFSTAATVTISATAPTVNGADIANDNGTVDLPAQQGEANGDPGHIWNNRPHQGQSFTTGANATGYTMNAVTLKNLNNTISNAPTFNVVVGSLSGTTMTQIGSTETAVAPNYAPNDYITFTFDTPLTLAANSTYGFLWGTAGSGFVTVNNADDSTFSGGTAISSGDDNAPDLNNVIDRVGDRVFHVDISANAIPEPSSLMLGLVGFAFALRRRRS